MNLTRRGFIGAVGAFAGLALAPAWHVFKPKRTIDLTPFCDTPWDGARYALDKPFAQDGQVIGCDARILVRTSLADAPELSGEARLPDIAGLPYWNAPRSPWKPWPRARYEAAKNGWDFQCPMCFGKGGFGNVRKCQPCEGSGYRVILSPKEYREWGEGLYERPCKTCKTTGWRSDVQCDYCKGEGQCEQALQVVDGLLIQAHYDAKLRALGDLEFSRLSMDFANNPSRGNVLAFRGDGFDGLVMEVTP